MHLAQTGPGLKDPEVRELHGDPNEPPVSLETMLDQEAHRWPSS